MKCKQIHLFRRLTRYNLAGFCLVLLLGITEVSQAQTVKNPAQVSGSVTSDDTNETLPGTSIVVKGTSIGTVTDAEGKYTLTLPDAAETLIFSTVGYTSQEISIGKQAVIHVKMKPDVKTLSEVVVVGYGTQKKSDLTSAISKVESKDIMQRVTPRLDEALQGQLSGVSVQQTSGVPGSAPLIRVRGIGSISSGNAPLFVIDGFPVEDNTIIGNLNMNDVESIEVLKDAASAAIYGSRGSNGVVLITTKSGKSGKPKISFNTYVGFQQPEKLIDFMDGNELGQMITEIRNHF
jgi:TonB-dependent starch-binding outer membrane protein SusC